MLYCLVGLLIKKCYEAMHNTDNACHNDTHENLYKCCEKEIAFSSLICCISTTNVKNESSSILKDESIKLRKAVQQWKHLRLGNFYYSDNKCYIACCEVLNIIIRALYKSDLFLDDERNLVLSIFKTCLEDIEEGAYNE